MPIEKNQKEILLNLIREAVSQDQQLRETFKIGDKFRFIRDRLNALQKYLEENLAKAEEQEKTQDQEITADETVIYIYLYNAQGMNLQSWQKMLSPTVFYEYSINRPIYRNKADIDAYIRAKPNKHQHGYLIVAVPKVDILTPVGGVYSKDSMGHDLIKVKEGALKSTRMIAFAYNNNLYMLDSAGQLVKKIQDTLSSS